MRGYYILTCIFFSLQVIVMAQTTKCELCVLCQEKTNEELVCPLDNPVGVRGAEAYKDIISLVNQFRDIDAAPHPNLELPDEATMQANRASWHKTCRQLYKASALDRAKTRYSKALQPLRKRPRRASTETNRNLCLFCNETTSKDDHSFQKVSLTEDIHDKAVSLGEDRIVARLAEGDLVAIEAKYHRNCYTKFNRRHYEMQMNTKQCQGTQDTEIIVENELLQFVNEEIAGGCRIFALQDLTDMMTERLEQHEIRKKVNCTRLKKRVLENFPHLTEEKGIRNRVFLVCSEEARKIISSASQTPEEELRTLLMAASILRKAVLGHDTVFNFMGLFPEGCEEFAVPVRLKYFFRQLLHGPKSSPMQDNSRAVLSMSQLTMLNITSLPANRRCEPPLAVFLALQLHSQTRSKKLVELLHQYCLSVSYKRVLTIEIGYAQATAERARANADIVCPSNLRHKIFTVAALDNLDHNPTSRTATSSFHGTGISMFQFPTVENPGLDQEPMEINFHRPASRKGPMLPPLYTFVPPMSRNLVTQPPVKDVQPQSMASFDKEEQHEKAWMKIVQENMQMDFESETDPPIMWSAYHASRSDAVGSTEKCIEAMLPLFRDKAATPKMIRHGMYLVKKTTEFLNSEQIPIMVVDQPLFDIAKKMQWTFPELFGEDRFLVMLGGLHIEMALWATMGDFLRGSGWPEVLAEAGIALTEAAAISYLRANDPMRTRYAHQITVVVLDSLLKRAYEDGGSEMTFDDWVSVACKEKPTVQFWLLIHKYEQLIFMFIRSHRERKFKLMVATLKKLVLLFFALDHQNYARWVSVFIRDLESLPSSIQEEFEAGHWTVSRSNHRYSSIPIDHAHEQANKRVKGVGGVIGITENPEMLERWIATGPEISRVLQQFTNVHDDGGQELPHHEEGSTSQHRFKCHVTNLMDVLQSRGNPFEESSADLVTLDNKVCVDKSAATSVRVLESRGEEQYDHFRKNVLDTNNVPLQAPIKKNKFLLFHEEKIRKKTAVQKKRKHFQQHTELYGQAFIMIDSRGGNLEEFFRHESSSSPPALASEGSIYSCNKSDLLACIIETSACTGLPADVELVAPDDYGVIVIDGGALIHSLPGTIVQGKTFAEYFTKVFCPRIQHELKRAARVDIVWDQYRSMSIKSATREKRGKGTRQRVSGSAKVPGNWQNFLSNAENKKELFSFLSTSIVQTSFQDGKQVYVTSGDQVLNAGNGPPMGRCNHEEADTRVLVHLLHALQYSSLGMVYTGDTDVVVILLCNFHHIKAVNPESEIWISFKTGKTVNMISLNNIASILGVTTCKALALFHAFTGSDSTSAFKYKGKRYCFKRKDEVPSLLSEFATITSTPFHISPELKKVVHYFVCKLYSDELITDDTNLDLVRMRVFCHRTQDVERIPPTSDALDQHLKRSVFQASIWITAHEPLALVPSPCNHGWMEKGGQLVPIWTTLPLARDVFDLDVKCACTKPCSSCKCKKAELKCSRLCKCKCPN